MADPNLHTGEAGRKSALPLGDLVRRLVGESRTLVRQEVELAKAEMQEKAAAAARHAAWAAAGLFLLLVGAIVLFTAINRGLTALLAQGLPLGVAVWLAPLLLTLALAIPGALLLTRGLRFFQGGAYRPEDIPKSLQENKEWLKRHRMH